MKVMLLLRNVDSTRKRYFRKKLIIGSKVLQNGMFNILSWEMDIKPTLFV